MIDVVFAIDKNFIQHFSVALTSLLETNREIVGKVFLINDIEEETLLTTAFSFIKRKYNKEIESLTINKSHTKKFRIDGHITQATYYRIFLAELLPENVEKVLFLDSDVIINGKIDYFLKLNFQKKSEIKDQTFPDLQNEWSLYAVNNVSDQKKIRLLNLGLRGTKYFNAGVLLINLRKWRKTGISERLLCVAENRSKDLELHDQDVLNIVLENDWKEINEKYNAINLEFSEILMNKEKYAIIHFTNFPKPWHFKNTHPFKQLYWIYLWKTPFKFYIPVDLTLGNILELKVTPRLKRFMRPLRKSLASLSF